MITQAQVNVRNTLTGNTITVIRDPESGSVEEPVTLQSGDQQPFYLDGLEALLTIEVQGVRRI